MKIVAVINQKGGVGKTTTCVNLSKELADRGHRVLLVDADPQSNSTSGLGFRPEGQTSLYDVLIERAEPQQVLLQTQWENLTVLPSSIDLAGAELDLASAMSRENRLSRALTPLKDRFDFALIDCPPALGLLSVNALTAAQETLVPIQCEYYAMEGLGLLSRTIDAVHRNLNAQLYLGSIVLTMYDQRTRLTLEVEEQIREAFGNVVLQTVIPRNVALAEAPSFGLPVSEYAPASRGAEAYRELAREVEQRWQ